MLLMIHFGAVTYKSCHHQLLAGYSMLRKFQVSPANNKINLSNFNSDKKTQSAALFWRMYKCRHEFHWNAVKVTVFPQTLTPSSQTSRQRKNAGVRVMGDRRFRVAQTSFSDHPFSAETLLCEKAE